MNIGHGGSGEWVCLSCGRTLSLQQAVAPWSPGGLPSISRRPACPRGEHPYRDILIDLQTNGRAWCCSRIANSTEVPYWEPQCALANCWPVEANSDLEIQSEANSDVESQTETSSDVEIVGGIGQIEANSDVQIESNSDAQQDVSDFVNEVREMVQRTEAMEEIRRELLRRLSVLAAGVVNT